MDDLDNTIEVIETYEAKERGNAERPLSEVCRLKAKC